MHQLVLASKDTIQAKCGEVFTLDKGECLATYPMTGWQSKVTCKACMEADGVPPDPTKEAKRRGIKTTQAEARKAEKAARAEERAQALEREAQRAGADAEAAAGRDDGTADDDSALAGLYGDDSGPGDDAAADGDAPPAGPDGPEPKTGGRAADDDGTWLGEVPDPDSRCPDGGVGPCPEPIDGRPQWGPNGWDNPERWAWWWGEDPGHPARVAGEHRLAAWWARRGPTEGPAARDAGPMDEWPAAPESSPDDEQAAVDVEAGSADPDALPVPPAGPGLAGADAEPVHGPGEAGPDHDGAEPVQDEGTAGAEDAAPKRPTRARELTELLVIPHVPVIVNERGSVLIPAHPDDIPNWFAFDDDWWCVDATITVEPHRRK